MEHRVDTTALDSTAKAVRDLSELVTQARDSVLGVRVQPGSFEEANLLKAKVKSSVDAYDVILSKVRRSLEELAEALDEVSKGSQETEAANNAAAREDPFADVWQELGGAPPMSMPMPMPTTMPTTAPPSAPPATTNT